jgi:hypothetical protein
MSLWIYSSWETGDILSSNISFVAGLVVQHFRSGSTDVSLPPETDKL